MRDFAVEDSLIHPKQITSAPYNAGRTQHAVNRAIAESPAQHQELADKTVEQRQACGCEHDKQKKRSVYGHWSSEATEFRDLVRMAPLVKNPRQHEESARGNSMRQHDEGRAIQPSLGEAENPQYNEAKVADRRIRDQLFHIRLHHRHQRRASDAD